MDLFTELMRLMNLAAQGGNESSLPLTVANNRQCLIAKHVEFLKMLQQQKEQPIVVLPTATMSNSSMPVVPIINDNLITIGDIISAGSNVVHSGKILLCRSILPPSKIDSLILLVDDPDGEFALRVSLRHFSKSVSAGTILAIMNPLLELTPFGFIMLHCENPMHVYFVDATESILQNLHWKADLPIESGIKKDASIRDDDPTNRANRYYVEKNYSKALQWYTKAIELDPKNPVLFSNRALTYLSMQLPLQALADAKAGLVLDESHLKLLYRKAKALLMLKRYRDAGDFLDKTQRRLKKELDGNREFKKLIEMTKVMLHESETYRYDLDQIKEEAKKSNILEHAENVASEMFKIKKIPGKGRGVVATRDIPFADRSFIMICKAFAFSTGNKLRLFKSFETLAFKRADYTAMVQQICDKLMANPELGRDFYQLYAGLAFGVLQNYDPSNPIDIDRIKAIVELNSFCNVDGNTATVGLWLLPSYLNHSCSDHNCSLTMVADFIFISAERMIKRGEEILIAYVDSDKPYEARHHICENLWGFTCNCSLCVADRQRLGHE